MMNIQCCLDCSIEPYVASTFDWSIAFFRGLANFICAHAKTIAAEFCFRGDC